MFSLPSKLALLMSLDHPMCDLAVAAACQLPVPENCFMNSKNRPKILETGAQGSAHKRHLRGVRLSFLGEYSLKTYRNLRCDSSLCQGEKRKEKQVSTTFFGGE